MSVDCNKPLQTRDGRPAKLIATVNAKDYPRICVVLEDGHDKVLTVTEHGHFIVDCEDGEDIVNVPVITHLYSNIWPSHSEMGQWRDHNTKRSNHGALGHVKATLKDGKAVSVELV